MKKVLVLVLILSLAVIPALAESPATDAITSASVADYYGDGVLAGDDLMNAINSYTGFYAVASVNPDGTPNLGFYIYWLPCMPRCRRKAPPIPPPAPG